MHANGTIMKCLGEYMESDNYSYIGFINIDTYNGELLAFKKALCINYLLS